jgi:thiamine-phosphate pyrophosphorylase
VKLRGRGCPHRGEERVGGLLLPWFAIGGIDRTNVEQVLAAGASRIVVVRAITEAPDPSAAAAELLDALDATSRAAVS